MPHGLPETWPEMEKEMERYLVDTRVERPLISFYEGLYRVWYRCRDQIKPLYTLELDQIKDALRQGRYLLSIKAPAFNAALYRVVLEQIVSEAVRHFPETAALQKAMESEKLQEDSLVSFLAAGLSFNVEQIQDYLKGQGWVQAIEAAGVEPAHLAFVLSAALIPFYGSLAAELSEQTDYTLWREGYCPVCGQKPFMAKLREEDGARVLECWLCHTQWQFPRLECPFCRNNDFARMHHFYTDEHPGRRVQLCERCKSYLKTVVVKEVGRTVILELENIFTTELDFLARREGYHPGEGLALLT
ncbi:MAG: formate dehydrogenase accessory protein FdhE [Bacillota bacterium]